MKLVKRRSGAWRWAVSMPPTARSARSCIRLAGSPGTQWLRAEGASEHGGHGFVVANVGWKRSTIVRWSPPNQVGV
eukprot:4704032-Prymnesium_polylepis.1